MCRVFGDTMKPVKACCQASEACGIASVLGHVSVRVRLHKSCSQKRNGTEIQKFASRILNFPRKTLNVAIWGFCFYFQFPLPPGCWLCDGNIHLCSLVLLVIFWHEQFTITPLRYNFWP